MVTWSSHEESPLKYQSVWTVAPKWVVCGTHKELEPKYIKVFGM